ncbi:MAG: hypothetical protein ACFFCW_27555, partial [Candidatus Hodarchaeota archaeon]
PKRSSKPQSIGTPIRTSIPCTESHLDMEVSAGSLLFSIAILYLSGRRTPRLSCEASTLRRPLTGDRIPAENGRPPCYTPVPPELRQLQALVRPPPLRAPHPRTKKSNYHSPEQAVRGLAPTTANLSRWGPRGVTR